VLRLSPIVKKRISFAPSLLQKYNKNRVRGWWNDSSPHLQIQHFFLQFVCAVFVPKKCLSPQRFRNMVSSKWEGLDPTFSNSKFLFSVRLSPFVPKIFSIVPTAFPKKNNVEVCETTAFPVLQMQSLFWAFLCPEICFVCPLTVYNVWWKQDGGLGIQPFSSWTFKVPIVRISFVLCAIIIFFCAIINYGYRGNIRWESKWKYVSIVFLFP